MIYVTGVGRCGTSTVARLLHEETHYCMGHEFAPADEWNPKGYYECVESYKRVALEVEVEWNLARYHAMCDCTKHYYGVKHPKICELENWILNQADLIIVCTRNRQAVIESMMNFRKPSTWKEANDFYDYRLGHITRVLQLPNVKVIDFTEYKMDEEVLDMVKRWL